MSMQGLDTVEHPQDSVPRGEMFVCTTTLKWFNTTRKFGLLAQREGLPDVLLLQSVLRDSGFWNIPAEGTTVVCEVEPTPKGLTCRKVTSIDESTASLPKVSRTGVSHGVVTKISGPEEMEVKWYHRLKGFGFFTRNGTGEDVFIHVETLRSSGMTALEQGQVRMVHFGPNDADPERRLMAVKVSNPDQQ
jgi:CspA family cold shock protein